MAAAIVLSPSPRSRDGATREKERALLLEQLIGVRSVSGRIRRSETYIGGERMEETYVRGVARGDQRDVEVTGVDFFDTVRDVRWLRAFYAAAQAGRLDPYEWLRAGLD